MNHHSKNVNQNWSRALLCERRSPTLQGIQRLSWFCFGSGTKITGAVWILMKFLIWCLTPSRESLGCHQQQLWASCIHLQGGDSWHVCHTLTLCRLTPPTGSGLYENLSNVKPKRPKWLPGLRLQLGGWMSVTPSCITGQDGGARTRAVMAALLQSKCKVVIPLCLRQSFRMGEKGWVVMEKK